MCTQSEVDLWRAHCPWMQRALQHYKAKQEALWVRAKKEVMERTMKRKKRGHEVVVGG